MLFEARNENPTVRINARQVFVRTGGGVPVVGCVNVVGSLDWFGTRPPVASMTT